jgi:hypothetical protein
MTEATDSRTDARSRTAGPTAAPRTGNQSPLVRRATLAEMLNLLCCSFTGEPRPLESGMLESGPSTPPTDFEPITLELGLALEPRPEGELEHDTGEGQG